MAAPHARLLSTSYTTKTEVFATVSAVALLTALSLAPQPAHAQAAPQAQAAQAPNVEEIVVTGSRIVRNGYEAPTPLTVVGTQELEAAAPQNLADYVNELPALSGSATP